MAQTRRRLKNVNSFINTSCSVVWLFFCLFFCSKSIKSLCALVVDKLSIFRGIILFITSISWTPHLMMRRLRSPYWYLVWMFNLWGIELNLCLIVLYLFYWSISTYRNLIWNWRWSADHKLFGSCRLWV